MFYYLWGVGCHFAEGHFNNSNENAWYKAISSFKWAVLVDIVLLRRLTSDYVLFQTQREKQGPVNASAISG